MYIAFYMGFALAVIGIDIAITSTVGTSSQMHRVQRGTDSSKKIKRRSEVRHSVTRKKRSSTFTHCTVVDTFKFQVRIMYTCRTIRLDYIFVLKQ